MPSKLLTPQPRWTIARVFSAITFFAFILHFSAGTLTWIQSIRSDWTYMMAFGAWRSFWHDMFVPAIQCALLLVAAMVGFLESICAYRRAMVWLAIVILGSVSAFAVDAAFCRYQISVDIAPKEYWDGGGFAHEYYTWWWYNDRWLNVPWYRDAGEFAFLPTAKTK